MNTILIENMIMNNGYKITQFNADIIVRKRGSYYKNRYTWEENDNPDEEYNRNPRERVTRRITMTLELENETVTFFEDYYEEDRYSDTLTTIGEIMQKVAMRNKEGK